MSIFEMDGFRITVPHGWKAFKVNDRILQICKGGEKDSDILSNPYLQLNYSGDAYLLPPSKDGYYDIVEYKPFKLGRYTWQGFECDSMGFNVAMLWTGEGKRQFQVSANLETRLGKIGIGDPDVRELLASIAPIDDTVQMGIIPPHIANSRDTAIGMTVADTSTLASKGKDCCEFCGAAFKSTAADFCNNCGAERRK